MAEDRYDLFFSYRQEDGKVVMALATLLRDCGVHVWLDRLDLIPGQNWRLEVERVISAASAIAICVGRGGMEGRLQSDLDLARARQLRLIPVLLPTAEGIPQELTGNLAVDLRSDNEENLASALKQLIDSLTGTPGAGEMTPKPVVTHSPAAKSLFESLTGLFRSARTETPEVKPVQPPEKPPLAPGPPKVEEAPMPQAPTPADPKRDVTSARNILRGQSASMAEIAALVKRLKADKQFGYARQLLARLRANPSAVPAQSRSFFAQQHALCTYKDPHLPADTRYDDALKILGEVDDLLSTKDQETLGLAGAICKYKWEAFGQRADLERSAAYYRRGYKVGVLTDLGYTAVNAAFVLDLLAFQDAEQAAKAGDVSASAEQSRKVAREIRQEVVSQLSPLLSGPKKDPLSKDWWFLVTVAEAYFGMEDYQNARLWIDTARKKTLPEDWQLESTLHQFASVARLHASALQLADDELEKWPSWPVLVAIAGGDNASGVRTALIGKVGLALSGGGFRASFYHIGVLAKLAELDVLRHVEVISCVSGGSIVGAYYYLELQQLLESKADAEITREDYIAIVRRMQRTFLDGVQTNIRTRVIADFAVNLKMVFQPGYSRTARVGELYDKMLFSRVAGKASRTMQDLLVNPLGTKGEFRPANHNWIRLAKVPVLALNATTLNTGHNWQFTATWMGEPPLGIDSEVDGNYRLRRMYYTEAPEGYRNYPLGQAVGASACVPGLFEPTNLPELYPDIDVRLVDGGVQDNQGIGAMLDEDCTVLLVSDASGQMGNEDKPGDGAVSALLRSNSILESRVREAEFSDVAARRRSSLLRGLMFIHLKKGLDVRPVDWIDCEDPAEVLQPKPLTPYGIRKDVQELVAGIRTDLDSFNDVEAYALMTSGYRMAEYEFPRCIQGFPRTSPATIDWQFLAVEPPMKEIVGNDRGHRELMALLTAAQSNAFKIWLLSRGLRITAQIVSVITIAALACGAIYEAFWGPQLSLVTFRALVTAALFATAGAIFGKNLVRVFRFRDTVRQIALGIALCVTGSAIGWLHILVFDRMYLTRGRIDVFLKKLPGASRLSGK